MRSAKKNCVRFISRISSKTHRQCTLLLQVAAAASHEISLQTDLQTAVPKCIGGQSCSTDRQAMAAGISAKGCFDMPAKNRSRHAGTEFE